MFLIREALAGINADIFVVTDGEKALDFLGRVEDDPEAPRPDLLLLDINLPKHKGGEVLRALRTGGRCHDMKVLVVTSSDSIRDRETMDALGTNGYFRKPTAYSEFMKLGTIVRLLLDESVRSRQS